MSRLHTFGSRVYARLPRFAQVLVDDTQHMNEYGRFMRVAMTIGTIGFLYRFADTMMYMEREKRQETPDERIHRRKEEKRMRDELRLDALNASSIVPPDDQHVRRIIDKANSSIL